MIKDTLPVRGHLTIALNGNVVREVENLIVDGGATWVTGRMLAAPDLTNYPAINTMEIGSSDTAAANGDDRASFTASTLGSSAIATTSQVTSPSIGIQFSTTFIAGTGTGAVTEAGLFAGTTLIARTVFGLVTKGEADELSITWTVNVSNGT
jgi:hypothetical protein